MLKERRLSKPITAATTLLLILALGLLSACGAPAAGGDGSASSGAGESSSAQEEVSEERAKELALSHAGIGGDADFMRVELDYDDGRKYWDLEFYKDGYEYDYEIDAESGKVISYSKEKEDGRPPEPKPEEGQPSEQISEEQAKVKALAHAGIAAADAVFGRVELDLDDQRPHYELEFRSGGYEYDCSVDLESGQVFDFEKDFDD